MNTEKTKWDITCVIYDCDGVLFDSLEANRRLYNHICISMDRSPITGSELEFCHMHTVFESLHHLFSDDPDKEARAAKFLKGLDLTEFISYLKMEPHVIQTIDILRARGIATAISTNRTTTMRPIMDRFGLWPHFDLVVSALDVKLPKPDPEGVEKILARLRCDRGKTLYVGDSEIDRKTARSASVRFVAYKHTALSGEPDAVISDHLALLDLLSDGLRPESPSSL